ncbi:hypothetical protein [Aequorivita flava]|uniref:Uncharacterized protein n=1 Tax=Aequorivita flava TaxID=3114371 RepID=A0AB35YU64_9FLAO
MNKITLKSSLKSLLEIPKQVQRRFGENKKYQSIVEFIIKQKYDDDNYSLPTIKELEQITGLKHYQLNKYFIEMYNSIVDDEINFEYNIEKTEIYFLISHNKTYSSFKCNNLSYIPKVGDNFTLPFLRAKFNFDMFYVYDVHHNFIDDLHRIDIILKQGLFNSFWHHRLDEAKFKNEISIMDLINLNEADIREKLGYRRY